MSNQIEFDSPANRIIAQQQPKNKFAINTSLSGIAFLRQMSIQGRLRYNFDGTVGNPKITITPSNGETYFLYRVNAQLTGGAGTFLITNNGTVRLSTVLTTTLIPVFELDILDSLVGDGTKELIIQLTGAAPNGTVIAFGWIENTSRIRDVAT